MRGNVVELTLTFFLFQVTLARPGTHYAEAGCSAHGDPRSLPPDGGVE